MKRVSQWMTPLLVAWSVASTVPTVSGQQFDPQRMTAPPNVIYNTSTIDDINLQSGALSIKIPLLKLPGRGIDTEINLNYSSKVLFDAVSSYVGLTIHMIKIDDTLYRTPAVGWSLGFPRMMGPDIGQSAGDSGIHMYATVTCDAYVNGTCSSSYYRVHTNLNDQSNFVMVDDAGSLGPGTFPAGYWSTDGSYTYLSNSGGGIHFKDGLNISSNGTTAKDSNGNMISCSTTGCTDTLGRIITYTSAGGPIQSVDYKDSTGVNQSITFTYQTYTLWYPWTYGICTFMPGSPNPCATNAAGAHALLKQVTLPNGRSYVFDYIMNTDGTTTGEIAKITLPTGGYIRYAYGWLLRSNGSSISSPSPSQRSVIGRYVSPNGTQASEQYWKYEIATVISSPADPPGYSKVTNPLGEMTTNSGTTLCVGIPTSVQYRDASGVVKKTIGQTVGFNTSTYYDWHPPSYCSQNPSNPRILSRTVTNDAGQQSKNTFSYGSMGNVAVQSEYDYGGALKRTTSYAYLHDSNAAYAAHNVQILNRVASKVVRDGAGNTLSQTVTLYDSTSLTPTSSVVQHDYAGFPSTYALRGNATVTRQYLNSIVLLSTVNNYDDLGNVRQTTDPKLNSTYFDYTDNFYNVTPAQITLAYATTVTRPVTSGVSHITKRQYYFDSGLQAAECGENFPSAATCSFTTSPSQPDLTTINYDLLNRPWCLRFADDGATCLEYNEATLPISIAVSKRVTGASANPPNQSDTTSSMVQVTVYDGLGRASQTQLNSDPGGVTYVDTAYDSLGRKQTVSNPYRSTTDPTYGITTFNYDALGRVSKLIPPDGTASANNVSTAYSGNCMTVTDQAGKIRKSCFDALGRLIQVFEPNSSNSLIYETDYQYDPLNNLLRVDQKGNDTNSANWRTRTFTYDWLSRLVCASNPENSSASCPASASGTYTPGTTGYTYDANGNMLTKTDAPSISTTYAYDAMDRLTGKTYSNGDPAVIYIFDQPSCLGQSSCFNIGRRTSMTDAGGSQAWAYDQVGRPSTDRRTTNSVTKNTLYTYNLDGSVATLTYPSSRTITYTPSAAGRTLSAVDTANSINYATAALYAPHGALSSLKNDASLVSTFYYNSRLQPCRISVKKTGTAPASCTDAAIGNVLDFSYNFSLGSANNGNVMGITNNRDTTRSQSFTYDALNRLATAHTTSTYATSHANCWGEKYFYDNLLTTDGAWGNLTTIAPASSDYTDCTQESGLSVTATTKNQISGGTYDSAGNMAADGSYSYTYDAENRLATAAGVTYTYDGDGKRVKKSNGKLYWYGVGSDPLTETDSFGTPSADYVFFNGKRTARLDLPSAVVHYYFSNHLGSANVVTSNTGTIQDESDYYPFGGERIITNSDPNQYKFTGKERDSESGLDNFGARYNSSSLGRFMSPDWAATPEPVPYAKLDNPQSLNLYSYVQNNPVTNLDADGHWCLFGKLGTTCNEPLPPLPPTPPAPPAVITPGTPQNNLANAQDSARSNPAFKPQTKPDGTVAKTFCNLATCDIVGAVGGPTDALTNQNGNPNLANTDARTLASSSQYREVSPEEAQNLANQGVPVVAVQANPSGHGHVATVRPELMPGLGQSLGQAPSINNIGRNRNIGTADQSFRRDQPVHYYAPNPH